MNFGAGGYVLYKERIMNTKFRVGDKVEWTTDKGLKQIGIIIESSDYGKRIKYLIKYDGKFVAMWEEDIERVTK